MAASALHTIRQELLAENHEPMVKLLDAMAREDFAASLGYDLSMLRLWLSRSLAEEPELMVTYADGRHGGRPTPPFVDAYESILFADEERGASTADLHGTIEAIRAWAFSGRE